MTRLTLSAAVVAIFSLTAFGQDVGQLMLRCSDAYAKARYAEAVDACTKVIVARAGSVEALKIRAAANEKRFYYAAAIGDYTELIRLTNGSIAFTFNRAELHRLKASYREAIADYTTIITKEPRGSFAAKAYFGRGLVYDQVGSKSQAQDNYRKAVELDPGFAEAKAKLTTEYPFGDMTITQAADNIIPGIPPTVNAAKKPTPSTPAPQNRPASPAPTQNIGSALPKKLLPERQGTDAEDARFETIASSTERGVKPTAADVAWASSYIFGQLNYWKNRYSSDKTAAEKIGYLYFRHSLLRNLLNDAKGAIADLSSCLVYSPSDSYCRVLRVYSYVTAGNAATALSEVNALIQANPDWNLAWTARAYVHCSMGNKQLAVADEKKTLQLGGRVPKPCQ